MRETETVPTVIHYLSEDSLLYRLPFWLKFAAFLALGTVGLLVRNYYVTIPLFVACLSLLLYVRLHRHRLAPFVAFVSITVVYSAVWLLFSRVEGSVVYVAFPWGTFVSDRTFHLTLSAVSRWLLILASGVTFLTVVTESELVDALHHDSIPRPVTVVVTTALNTVRFTLEDVPDINRSLTSRGHPTTGVANRAKRVLYIGIVALLSNLKRVDTLSASYAVSRRPSSQIDAERLAVDVDRVGYGRGETVVEDVHFELEAGESIGIYGPTGSGKSTILNVVGGIVPDLQAEEYEGVVRVDGEPVEPATLREMASIAFQEPENQFIFTTVERELFFRLAPSEAETARELMERFEVEHLASKSLGDLSTGQRKILSLVAALARDAPVLLLDEPTANLDQRHRRQLFECLDEFCEDSFVLVSTHYDEKVSAERFDRLLVSDDGWRRRETLPTRLRQPVELDSFETTPGADESAEPILELDDVEYAYPDGTVSLRNCSATIRPGEVVAITGPNGAGKTTFLDLVTGKIEPTSGSVTVRTDSIGYLHQEPDKQLLTRSVRDELTFGPRGDELDEETVRSYLELAGLEDASDRHPFFLSRGQKQLLLVLSLLVNRPDVLVIDEPFTGLDAESIRLLTDVLGDVYREYRPTILLAVQSSRTVEPILSREIRLGDASEQ